MFTSFGLLPTELRLKIWDYVCAEPRIIEVRDTANRFIDAIPTTYGYCFIAAIPAVLHACRESREVGLRHYQLDLRSVFLEGDSRVAPIYVNWQLDTIYLADEVFDLAEAFAEFCARAGIDAARFRHLAVNSFAWDTHCYYEMEQKYDGRVMTALDSFVSLEDFTVVLERADYCGYGSGLSYRAASLRPAFVEPDRDMRVVRGWKFLSETVQGVRKLLQESDPRNCVDLTTWEPIWDKKISIMAADRGE